ncbi:hypothetical protein D1839_09600 [Roseburia sp. 1XD42-34]|nr:hypothetical protein [Roseburia sp. 1XD42-34]RKI78084.1 hypothetical protein D7V87_09590 [Clostridium sp. 1xD42-85]
MKHPYEKFVLVELISLGAAIPFAIFALMKGYTIVVIICLFLLATSLICDSLVQWYLYQSFSSHVIKQAGRALLIGIFAIFFLFQL